jgi:Zn-dependent peptidase ImmA (M78 family)
MAIDLQSFAAKLRRYREQFDQSVEDVAARTGIDPSSLEAMEQATQEPTGDEVLILADYFRCDFRFFISNDGVSPIDQTEKLFRIHGDDLSPQDRWAVQEFLFLCENEQYLNEQLSSIPPRPFTFEKRGSFQKGHGIEAAKALRSHLGYSADHVPDVFHDLRTLGIHVFRRRLENSKLSGLYLRHPTAGKCVLVNYDEDVFRQRFTAAHEAAHAILDDEEDFVVSFKSWDRRDLREIRANTFANRFLVPPGLIDRIKGELDEERMLNVAKQLKVNVEVLVIGLREADRLSETEAARFKMVRVPSEAKDDPELPATLLPKVRERRRALLEKGLSFSYVGLCERSYREGVISAGRLAEVLLVDEAELADIGELFDLRLDHA